MFRYHSGEDIRLGDRVRVNGDLIGVVRDIILPDSDQSKVCNCPDGGVLTVCNQGGKPYRRFWSPPDEKYWEDLDFLGRTY